MESVWKWDSPRVVFPSLHGKKKVDTLIIGGGIAGVLCAYRLKENGVNCALIEAKEVFSGTTGNTTAKLTLQHGLIYDKMIKQFGERRASLYLEAQRRALSEYEKLCEKIDCGYEKCDSVVYSLSDREKIQKEYKALKRLGADAEIADSLEIPVDAVGAVCVRGGAQFDPLKFLYKIAHDLPIYEHTKAIEVKDGYVVTSNGEIHYKNLVLATHFPILNKHGGYFLKLYQHRSYVLALRGVEKLSANYVDESGVGLSFRSYGDLLLLGGGGHRTGKRGGSFGELEKFVNEHYNEAEIVGKWATQDCMTLDGVPYVGRYSRSTPNCYVITGFNKWGMTSAMVSASIIADLVQGKPNPYADVFSPSRSIFRPQLFVNTAESLIGLLTPTAPRCPHLGCALKYNKAEHSWDCPCHGSRFSESGELIDNPATDDSKSIGK